MLELDLGLIFPGDAAENSHECLRPGLEWKVGSPPEVEDRVVLRVLGLCKVLYLSVIIGWPGSCITYGLRVEP